MTHEEISALGDGGVVVLDPSSILVSSQVTLGSGVVLWPNTTLQAVEGGTIVPRPGFCRAPASSLPEDT